MVDITIVFMGFINQQTSLGGTHTVEPPISPSFFMTYSGDLAPSFPSSSEVLQVVLLGVGSKNILCKQFWSEIPVISAKLTPFMGNA